METQNKVHWVNSSRSNQDLAERYDQWAKEYEYDLGQDGWQAWQLAADFLARYVPQEARILDAAAGTGLVGQALANLGYHNLKAMDLSENMLEEARKKNVYQELYQMVMGEPLDFTSDSFDAVVCSGGFTEGHAPPSSLDEMVRITKPDGHIVFTLPPRVYTKTFGFKEKMASLESESKWKLVQVSEKFRSNLRGKIDWLNQIWVFQVTS